MTNRLSMSKTINTVIMYIIMLGFTISLLFSTHFLINSNNFGHDSSIFAYIGYAITQGKTLYIDAWDNKGPLLYFVNALGVSINYQYGIFVLEFITLFLSIIFLYRTANLFVNKGTSTACAIISMMPLTLTLEGGNLSEEYALPFTIVAFYYIAKFFANDYNLKKYEMMIVGASISAVFLLRINILAFLGCAVLGVVIVLIMKKEFKMLGTVSLYASLGFLIFAVPFLIYLIYNKALMTCIDSAYFGVLGTFSDITIKERINTSLKMLLMLLPSGALIIMPSFLILFLIKKIICRKKQMQALDILSVISIFGIITTTIANSISGAYHMHYYMSFVPVLIIPTVWIASEFNNSIKTIINTKKDIRSLFKSVVIFLLSTTIFVLSIFSFVSYLSVGCFSGSRISTQRANKIVNYIYDNTEEYDTILVFGDIDAVSSYYKTKRMAASNYFYYGNGRFSDEAKNKFANKIFKDIKENNPKIIMFDTSAKQSNNYNDFVSHCYNKSEWFNYINDNYNKVNNDYNYEIFLHK